MRPIALGRQQNQGRNSAGQPGQILGARIGKTGQGRHHGGTVHDGQSFFWHQLDRLNLQLFVDFFRRTSLPLVNHLTFANQHGGHIREWC